MCLVALGCGDNSDTVPDVKAERSADDLARARFYEHVGRASEARRKKDWAASVRHLQAALAERSDHEASLVELASALTRLGRREDAVVILERLRKAHPDLPRSHVLLADVLAENAESSAADLPRAESLYRHALQMEPNIVGPRIGLARVLLRQRRFEASGDEYATVLGTDPHNLDALTGVGRTLLARDRAAEAVPWLLKAVDAGTRASGRRDVPAEMDTRASFEATPLSAPRLRPALEALRRARDLLGGWPDDVPEAVRRAAERPR